MGWGRLAHCVSFDLFIFWDEEGGGGGGGGGM